MRGFLLAHRTRVRLHFRTTFSAMADALRMAGAGHCLPGVYIGAWTQSKYRVANAVSSTGSPNRKYTYVCLTICAKVECRNKTSNRKTISPLYTHPCSRSISYVTDNTMALSRRPLALTHFAFVSRFCVCLVAVSLLLPPSSPLLLKAHLRMAFIKPKIYYKSTHVIASADC